MCYTTKRFKLMLLPILNDACAIIVFLLPSRAHDFVDGVVHAISLSFPA